ncbi:MAG: vitamin K epoxide reductase family protein [Candidatus Acidiferrales bacterium]
MTSWILLGLAGVGLALSLYFTLAYYGWIEAHALPAAFCRREERSCLTVLQTPYARVFGVPNSVLGLLLYLLVGAVAVQALSGAPPAWLWQVTFAGAAFSVLLAPYLIWALVVQLKTWCRL